MFQRHRFNDAAKGVDRLLPDMDLTVYETPELKGFKDTLSEAITILSQSPTARKLAQTAIDAGYEIMVTDDAELRGEVVHHEKLIFLSRKKDPNMVALTLMHELAHVSQYVNGRIGIDTLADHPLQSIQTLMAMEADARAYEMCMAVELAYPQDGGKAFPDMIDTAVRKLDNPHVSALMKGAKPLLPDDIDMEAIMAGCFKSFYGYAPMKKMHEDVVLNRLESHAKEKIMDEKNFGGRLKDGELARLIDSHCRPYVTKRPGYIVLESDQFTAISKDTQRRLMRLFGIRYTNEKTRHEEAWKGVVYKAPKGSQGFSAP